MNPWHDVDPGKRAPDIIDCIIEVPRGCHNKYELDKKTGLLRLDRVLYSAVFYPANYGFIPRTYCDDHDPLDILVLGQEPVVPMCIVTARPIGVMQMVDQNEEDDKIIAIHEHDPAFTHYRDISHLPEHTLNELRRFFEDYKALEHKKVRIERFIGRVDAQNVIAKSLRLYEASFNPDGSKREDAPILNSDREKQESAASSQGSRSVRIEAARRAADRLKPGSDQNGASGATNGVANGTTLGTDETIAAADAQASAAPEAAPGPDVAQFAAAPDSAPDTDTSADSRSSTFDQLTIDARTLDVHALRPRADYTGIDHRAQAVSADDTQADNRENSVSLPQMAQDEVQGGGVSEGAEGQMEG